MQRRKGVRPAGAPQGAHDGGDPVVFLPCDDVQRLDRRPGDPVVPHLRERDRRGIEGDSFFLQRRAANGVRREREADIRPGKRPLHAVHDLRDRPARIGFRRSDGCEKNAFFHLCRTPFRRDRGEIRHKQPAQTQRRCTHRPVRPFLRRRAGSLCLRGKPTGASSNPTRPLPPSPPSPRARGVSRGSTSSCRRRPGLR